LQPISVWFTQAATCLGVKRLQLNRKRFGNSSAENQNWQAVLICGNIVVRNRGEILNIERQQSG